VTRWSRLALNLSLISLLTACRGEDVTETGTRTRRELGASVTSIPTATSNRETSASPLEELQRITEEDYEEEALIDITEETLEAELDRLEAEISP
jgi:hypothetical protein